MKFAFLPRDWKQKAVQIGMLRTIEEMDQGGYFLFDRAQSYSHADLGN